MDRLKVLCFAGTYGLALVCELARFVVREPGAVVPDLGLTALGWLVQTLFLANLALEGRMVLPVTTAFESMMVLSWIVALIGLYLMLRSPAPVAVGIFVLPLVLGLVVGAGWFAPRAIGLAGLGRHDRVLGHGARDLPAGRGRLHLRGVRRRADVPGPDAAAQAQAAVAVWAALPSLEQSERVNRGAITRRLPAADLRAADRPDPEPGRPAAWPRAPACAPLDRPEGPQRPGDVAGLRGAACTPGSGRRCGAGA